MVLSFKIIQGVTRSDHSRIELSTRYVINNGKINKNTRKGENIKDVNFHDKTKWELINDITNSKIETSIIENMELKKQLLDFINIIHRVSLDELPKKMNFDDKKGCPREIRTIKNRIKMLTRCKRNTKSTRKKKRIENKIYEAEELLLNPLPHRPRYR